MYSVKQTSQSLPTKINDVKYSECKKNIDSKTAVAEYVDLMRANLGGHEHDSSTISYPTL